MKRAEVSELLGGIAFLLVQPGGAGFENPPADKPGQHPPSADSGIGGRMGHGHHTLAGGNILIPALASRDEAGGIRSWP